MKLRSGLKLCLLTCVSSTLASCAWIPSYISEPGVEINRVTTPTARVASAHFWQDRQRVVLRGEIVPQPITKSALGGHVHAAVIAADGAESACKTTRQRIRPRYVRKPYSMTFDALPAAGSQVQVYHHLSASHERCILDEYLDPL